jgi:antitoxin (DNA-binding transcriptional repressor) of toxin-antitoxin stability system
MSNTVVEVRDLPKRFAEVIALIASGGEVVVTEGSVPRARLVALTPGQVRRAGLHPGAITTEPDFDEPLPDEYWSGAP